jgi:carbon-monoxide dehydrogenase medium subunit
MIPGNFEYHRPSSVDEVVALMSEHGDEGRVVAGGHSLIPMMKLRLAVPSHLIDLRGLDGLKDIGEDGGAIVIGAMVTQTEILASGLLSDKCPILGEAAALIADPQVRNCGTLGGNVANGDPGNDLPAVMMVLGASYVLAGAGGERTVAAVDFCHGIYDTALEPGEMLTEIRIPTPPAGHGYAYRKMKRKVGDFATAATAVILKIDGGTCTRAALALSNAGPAPIVAEAAAAALTGKAIDDAAIDAAAEKAIEIADPVADLHGPVAFRKQMAGEMTRRAVRAALARAGGG